MIKYTTFAASGMCEAGRITHHLANSIGDPRNMIMIVGYQAENTLGKKIVLGEPVVNIFGEDLDSLARVLGTLKGLTLSITVDKAITDARQIADDSARLAAEQAVVKLVGNDVPEIPIATYAHERVTSSRVHNLIYSPMTYLDFQSCWISGS